MFTANDQKAEEKRRWPARPPEEGEGGVQRRGSCLHNTCYHLKELRPIPKIGFPKPIALHFLSILYATFTLLARYYVH